MATRRDRQAGPPTGSFRHGRAAAVENVAAGIMHADGLDGAEAFGQKYALFGGVKMTGSTIYAAQKTREAVNCLALLELPLRERLSRAAFALHILTAEEIPDANLQKELEAILSKVYDNATPDDHGLSHITDNDVSATARKIVELFEVCVELHTRNPNPTRRDQ